MVFVLANVLQPLIDVFGAVLVFFHDQAGLGWGMSIIALTVVVRACLLPLTLKQARSMQSLQRLSPDIKALQAKYKGDKQRLNEEMMKFYRENKVNPLGSCLPLVAQMPVFFALFYLLQGDLRLDICGQEQSACGDLANPTGAEQFLFIPDLTDKATGGVLITLIVLYIGSQVASSLMMSMSADRNQRLLFLALPFLFVAFILNFPAGLIVYWITTNVWTIGQQYFVRKTVGPIRPPTSEPGTGLFGLGSPARAAAAASGGGSGGKASGSAKAKESGGGSGAGTKTRVAAPPPTPPRKKKKRSGRRR